MIIRETDLLAPDASDPDSVENAAAAGAPTWPLLMSYNLVPPLQEAPPLRVEWEAVRRMFSETPTWPHLLRALHVPEWPEQIPSAPKFEQALRTLQKHGTLISAA